MAEKFERLSFTKDWNNASDFPTYEENETQVRADMQLLHDEVRDFINDKLIPGVENLAVPGTGDMKTDVYDPTGVMQDVFAYARAQAAAAVGTAKSNTESAVSEYDTTQTAKFNEVNVRLGAAETALRTTPGAITLFKEYRAAGTYTVELPSDTVAVYALAVGAGGGGGDGYYEENEYNTVSAGGGGGGGGRAVLVGPLLPGNITNTTVVVGAGGAAKTAGGSSSVFGIAAPGGGAGGTWNTSTANSGAAGGSGGGDTEVYPRLRGGDGGNGALNRAYKDGSKPNVDKDGDAGSVSDTLLTFMLTTLSAGGGGGASYIGPSDGKNASAGSGGVCGFGKGGDGGAYNANGADGGQCCGGGGGGGKNGCTGGKGGDGYVAIWVQRMAGAS